MLTDTDITARPDTTEFDGALMRVMASCNRIDSPDIIRHRREEVRHMYATVLRERDELRRQVEAHDAEREMLSHVRDVIAEFRGEQPEDMTEEEWACELLMSLAHNLDEFDKEGAALAAPETSEVDG